MWSASQPQCLNFSHCFQHCFSIGSASAAELAKDNIFHLQCTLMNVPAYVQAWHSVVYQLASTPWDFTPYQHVQKYVDGLSHYGTFINLKDCVYSLWDIGYDRLYALNDIATNILEIDIDRRCGQHPSQNQTVCPSPAPIPHTPQATTTSILSDTISIISVDSPPIAHSNLSHPHIQCMNCHMFGHLIDKCWAEGGGNVGGRKAYRKLVFGHILGHGHRTYSPSFSFHQ